MLSVLEGVSKEGRWESRWSETKHVAYSMEKKYLSLRIDLSKLCFSIVLWNKIGESSPTKASNSPLERVTKYILWR